MGSPVELALQQLQAELGTTREQLGRMATAHDQLRDAHDALRAASDQAFQQKAAEIQASEDKLGKLLFTQKFDLLDLAWC